MSTEAVHYLNMFLGAGAIFLQVFSLLCVLMFFFWPKNKENKFLFYIKKNFIPLEFFISFSALFFSLFYSEVLHYAPCYHCWVQRIFLFPQVFIFGMAWWRKDKNVFFYSLPLLLVGVADSLYHNYIYYFGEGVAPCDASGVSCVQQFVSEYRGYISIPMLSLTVFIALSAILLISRKDKDLANSR